ncbi:MAG: adenylosuccinate synthase [Gaiellales bacterium]|jgi:adenylosuccinate synthase|nr:adenylosuccinate synthase [Gaiellales bacterium]
MSGAVVIGAQWGDEGKGKIVDLLAERFEIVARYQGGNNAGHTVVHGDETFKFHLLPSGILEPDKICILGNGVVIDPEVLVGELDALEARGRSTAGLRISMNAHVIMPWHRLLDSQNEVSLGSLQIGTTRRGIGPAYADKASRVGIRVQDLFDLGILQKKVAAALAVRNREILRGRDQGPLYPNQVVEELAPFAARLQPYAADTSLLIDQALKAGKRVLFEGAQGTLLDLDNGTYPFVTSSNPIAGGACTGTGVGPTKIDSVLGIAKAYLTRVGAGPFPSEADEERGTKIRDIGAEFGTTTGRERRCGWLDLVGLRYAVRLNGLTELVLTKLDVLSEFDSIPVCVAYKLPDGTITEEFPAHQSDFHHAEPVWEERPGWNTDISDATEWDQLPQAARDYVEWVADQLGIPVTLVGVGVRRDQVLAPHGMEAVARSAR